MSAPMVGKSVHSSMGSSVNPYVKETMGYPTGVSTHVPIRPHPNATQGQHLIKQIESFYVRPRWIFVRIETVTGVVGWAEATLESHSEAMEGALKDVARKWVYSWSWMTDCQIGRMGCHEYRRGWLDHKVIQMLTLSRSISTSTVTGSTAEGL